MGNESDLKLIAPAWSGVICKDTAAGAAAAILSVKGAAVPPAAVEFCTVIAAVPVDAMLLAGTCARSSSSETYVVGSAVPFQLTKADGRKPWPSTVRTNDGPPAVAMLGSMEFEASAGSGWTVNETGADTRASDAAPVATVTEIVPAFST